MQKCPNCAAPLQDLIEQCGFCGTITDRGVQARQARAAQSDADRRAAEQRAEQRAEADQLRARAAAQHAIDTAGRWSFFGALLGGLLCCFVPVGPVLGIIFGMRARGLAAQHRLSAGLGSAGLVFGVVGLVLSMMMWLAVGVMMVKENQRRAQLKADLGDLATSQLQLKSACALTELELLDTRFEGFSSLDDFECGATADLELKGDEAVLRQVQFRNKEKRVEVVACLQHRNKWSVKALRSDDDCAAPKEAPPRPHEQD